METLSTLNSLFAPGSVAVIGASSAPGPGGGGDPGSAGGGNPYAVRRPGG